MPEKLIGFTAASMPRSCVAVPLNSKVPRFPLASSWSAWARGSPSVTDSATDLWLRSKRLLKVPSGHPSTLSRIGIGLLSKTRPADLPVKVAES